MRWRVWGLIAVMTLCAAFLAAASAEAAPPKGRTYGGMIIMQHPMTGAMYTERACLTFRNKKKMCTDTGECGTWRIVEKVRKQNRWAGEIFLEFEGMMMRFEFNGQTEARGRGNADAITATGCAMDFGFNGGFAAVEMSENDCLDWVAGGDDS